jgi:hypothetical protein
MLEDRSMDVGQCFRDAFEIYKKNVLVLVVAAVLFEVLGIISLLILVGPLTGGLSLMTLRAVRSPTQQVELAEMFRAFDRFVTLFVLFWITFIPILIGLVLCVVPGVLLSTIWMFCFFWAVDRDEGVFASLRSSKEMVQQAGFSNCLLLTIVEIALVSPSAVPAVGSILSWFTAPLAWLIGASAYAQLAGFHKRPEKPPVAKGERPCTSMQDYEFPRD